MKIAVIGTGYVGLPTAAGFTNLGFKVSCIDIMEEKINKLKKGIIPIYEPGLSQLIKDGVEQGLLSFTTSMKEGVKDADVIILAVGTPTDPETNRADMKYIKGASKELAPLLNKYCVVVTKSTVPIGTGSMVQDLIRKENPDAKFDYASIPEFLKEGAAVKDFFNPDRIVIGVESEKAKKILATMYHSFEVKGTPITYYGIRSAEAVKYASNSLLGIKISFINEIANLCEKSGANIEEVAEGIGLDSRIGKKFLQTGPGFGGSCFPKDMTEIVEYGKLVKADQTLIETALNVNSSRKVYLSRRALNIIGSGEKTVGVLGLAFKAETDDVRYSASFDVVKALLNKNFNVKAYDKKAMENFDKELQNKNVNYCEDLYECVSECDAIIIMTEWNEFTNMDLSKIKEKMKGNIIIDYRNLLERDVVEKHKFSYYCLGK
ncbi:MAG: UDP-glucose/GDP-mannose dehydrogenase family protein [Alphaproteobacteria bacterium]|jgi:UDPglucose 6-dehydrogenase|nr:UDP-glucose/GDP-mannose dehydrogenase family protein [Alphaproteobacteria bacterium]